MTRAKKRTVLAIHHSEHENLGSFERALLDAGMGIDTLRAYEAGPDDWRKAAKAPILVVMGGPMGVYEKDRYPFLVPELDMLRARIPRDLPTLGICLGAQLIGEAAGSIVVCSGRREVGWYGIAPLEHCQADRLLGLMDWSVPMFHWHQDTFALPPGAVHLMSSERFAQQAFRLGKRVYGLQFHPEVVPCELIDWVSLEPDLAYGAADGIQTREQILAGARDHGGRLTRLAHELVQRFLALAD